MVRTLLVCGSETQRTARSIIDLLAAVMPHAYLREIPGAGHMAPVTHGATVNEAIFAHLRASVGR